MASPATTTPSTTVTPPSGPATISGAEANTLVSGAEAVNLISAGQASRQASIAEVQQQGLQLSPAFQQLHIAPKSVKIGLRMSSGSFVDYSAKLSKPQQDELSNLLTKYGGDTPGFTIDLEELKDGKRNVLIPLRGESKTEFEQDMKKLRELATTAIGANLYFNRYQLGYRTSIGKVAAFTTAHSKRLQELKYEKYHLEDRLNELREEGEKKKILAAHLAAKGLVSDSKLLLEKMRKSKDLGRDLEGDGRKQRIAHMEEQAPHEAAVLYGATHLLDENASADAIQQAKKQASEYVKEFSLPHTDREPGGFVGSTTEGLLNLATFSLFDINYRPLNGLSKENEKQESAFEDQLVLLGATSRSGYEFGRAVLRAEERSDGQELFFVQLANLVADPAKNEQDVIDFVTGSEAAAVVYGNLHEVDKGVYRQGLTMVALKYQSILKGIPPISAANSSALIDAFDAAFDRAKTSA